MDSNTHLSTILVVTVHPLHNITLILAMLDTKPLFILDNNNNIINKDSLSINNLLNITKVKVFTTINLQCSMGSKCIIINLQYSMYSKYIITNPLYTIRDSLFINKDSLSINRDSLSISRDSQSINRDSQSINRDSLSINKAKLFTNRHNKFTKTHLPCIVTHPQFTINKDNNNKVTITHPQFNNNNNMTKSYIKIHLPYINPKLLNIRTHKKMFPQLLIKHNTPMLYQSMLLLLLMQFLMVQIPKVLQN
jgi:hypothetical protein